MESELKAVTVELIFNGLMLLFFIYCFFYIGATVPPASNKELGAAQWPQILLALLVIFLVVNIVKIIKNLKNVSDDGKLSTSQLKSFLTGKMFIGIVTIFVLTFLLNYIGFVPACILFLLAYSRLLGEKRWWFNLICAVLITAVLYLVFSRCLSILLPRGEGIFRTFALLLETT